MDKQRKGIPISKKSISSCLCCGLSPRSSEPPWRIGKNKTGPAVVMPKLRGQKWPFRRGKIGKFGRKVLFKTQQPSIVLGSLYKLLVVVKPVAEYFCFHFRGRERRDVAFMGRLWNSGKQESRQSNDTTARAKISPQWCCVVPGRKL